MAKRLKLYEAHSFSTSSNSYHHTTMLNADVPRCYRTLKVDNCNKLSHDLVSTQQTKKVPTFELSVTLSNLNIFSKFLHCWKAYKICFKTHTTLYQPHLKHVATLPWEIENSNFLQI